MFSRPLRLFRKGFDQARGLLRANSPHFAVSYGEHPEESGSGIIVPKKVVKGAVARHLLKRRVRTAVTPWSSSERVIIIVARTGAEKLTYRELENELSSLFASIIKR